MAIYRTLLAWQHAIGLVSEIYTLSEGFPATERYGLAQQIRDAAASVPSNIAEGRGRGTRKDFRRFLQQARGSLYEVETQLTIARMLGYVTETDEEMMLLKSAKVLQLLNGLIRSLSDQRPATRDHP